MWTPLLFGIIFNFLSETIVEGKHLGCYHECEHGFNKVQQKLLRALRATNKHAPLPPVNHAADSCPAFLSELTRHERSSLGHNKRSLAPWRIRTVHKPDMLPPTYEEAECLCEGCIINGTEDRTYNSVPVEENRLFLKKVKCPFDENKYSLEYEYVKVTVACTCVVPKH
ncbi:interleukin-17C [Myxocyprinus asiaticus]|uniref:interleukin-17C n=1 Tax=Myxocyprinus asiaticus TaxID=70543 RepID=UPI002222AB63|nr:interleukin-17C [Myxocyprinus asiaticus]